MRKGFAPLPFSNTERSQYSGLDCAVMPDMSSLGFSCGSVEVAIVWCGSTQDHASSSRPASEADQQRIPGRWLMVAVGILFNGSPIV